MPSLPLNYLSIFTESDTYRHTHSRMHYWRNKLLFLPCCELCWVMSESFSPSDSHREGASHFFPFGVQLRAALHSFLLCFTLALSLLFFPFPPPNSSSFKSFSVLLSRSPDMDTHSNGLHAASRERVRRRSFIPTKSHWSLSLLTQDDKVPFAADAQKGQGCRCIFAWGIE